ncbi:BrnT family toxin [Nevskia sp.]|uniref:BrnT family toxin n=1 Tax=Nevskia sp. TaxID=1929292 RepID=UPI0025D84CEC|nr:BrnT family toxin [Nevskia sp.]
MNPWDEAKRELNFRAHGVDFADLEGFLDGDLLTREDLREAYRERRFQSVGMVNEVALFVVWTPRGDEGDTPHLISARKAENHEHKA